MESVGVSGVAARRAFLVAREEEEDAAFAVPSFADAEDEEDEDKEEEEEEKEEEEGAFAVPSLAEEDEEEEEAEEEDKEEAEEEAEEEDEDEDAEDEEDDEEDDEASPDAADAFDTALGEEPSLPWSLRRRHIRPVLTSHTDAPASVAMPTYSFDTCQATSLTPGGRRSASNPPAWLFVSITRRTSPVTTSATIALPSAPPLHNKSPFGENFTAETPFSCPVIDA
jgi:hypothetical protein